MPKDKEGKEITQEQFDALSPEDKAAATKVPGPTPQIEASQIKGLKELMTETLTDFAANAVQEPPIEPSEEVRVQPTDLDPLQQALEQATGPKFAKMDIDIAGATDAATFYATHPDMVKHKDEIEQAFNDLKAQGKAFSRQAVYEWWRGNDKNFQRLVGEAVEADKKKITEAEESTTVDSSGRPVIDSPKVDHNSGETEVNKAVEGLEF